MAPSSTTALLVVVLLAACMHATDACHKKHQQHQQPPRDSAGGAVSADFMALLQRMFPATLAGDQPGPKTVAELAEQAPGNMSLLIDGVERAGLHKDIANPDFEATVFAPTNWAFEVALVKLKLSPKDLWTDQTALTNLLSYHTISGAAIASSDLKDGQQLTTLSKHKLTVKVDKAAGASIQGDSDTAKVLAADIRAGKSIIHVIDTVLIPPKKPSAAT